MPDGGLRDGSHDLAAALGTPRAGHTVGPRSHTGLRPRPYGGEPYGTPSSKRHHDERFTAERRPVGHRRVGSGHPLGHRAGTMRPPALWHTADSLLGVAAQPTRDARVAPLLCVRERPGTRTGEGGQRRARRGGRPRDGGSGATAPHHAEAFHPVLGRCFRFVDEIGGQPVHCPQPPAWRGTFATAGGRSYQVDACAAHRGSLMRARPLAEDRSGRP
jgi:hypothetical protein